MTHDPRGALADFNEAIRLSPQDAHLYIDRGIAEDFLGDNAKALADFNAAIELDPKQPLGYVNRGQTLLTLGKRDEAIASVKKALGLAPGFPPALEVLKKLGIEAEIEPKPQQAAVSHSDISKNFFLCTRPVSNVHFTIQQVNAVIAACSAVIDTPGGHAMDRSLVHVQRGAMYRRLHKFELALKDFDMAIQYDPKSALAYTGRGNALRGLHQFDAAITDHTKAIELKPDYAEAYYNRGNARYEKDDLKGALADYDAAIRLKPRDASAHFNRALARGNSGDTQGAEADLREALRLDPHMPDAADMLKQIVAEELMKKHRRH